MGLSIPDLDQKEFETRFQEAVAKLPAYAKEWTEYNDSDPGITIIELLAWMADIHSYRLNRIRDEHYEAFLELLGNSGSGEIKERFLAVQKELETPYKAVTLEDFEYLTLAYDSRIAKAKARADKQNNSVSVMIVPVPSVEEDEPPMPEEDMIEGVRSYLQQRALLTTLVEVEPPQYTKVNVVIDVQTRYQDPDSLKTKIRTKVKNFLHPVYGGEEQKGWEFGEDIHISQLYMLLSEMEGIERIDSIYFSGKKTTVTIDKNVLPTSGTHAISVTSIQPLGSCS
jgi:hypothetical protein